MAVCILQQAGPQSSANFKPNAEMQRTAVTARTLHDEGPPTAIGRHVAVHFERLLIVSPFVVWRFDEIVAIRQLRVGGED